MHMNGSETRLEARQRRYDGRLAQYVHQCVAKYVYILREGGAGGSCVGKWTALLHPVDQRENISLWSVSKWVEMKTRGSSSLTGIRREESCGRETGGRGGVVKAHPSPGY